MGSEEEIKKTLLRKLLADRIIGGRHTAIENLPKGFPKHLRGRVKEIAEDLVKDGLLLRKPTSYGLQVSLNPNRLAEIDMLARN